MVHRQKLLAPHKTKQNSFFSKKCFSNFFLQNEIFSFFRLSPVPALDWRYYYHLKNWRPQKIRHRSSPKRTRPLQKSWPNSKLRNFLMRGSATTTSPRKIWPTTRSNTERLGPRPLPSESSFLLFALPWFGGAAPSCCGSLSARLRAGSDLRKTRVRIRVWRFGRLRSGPS